MVAVLVVAALVGLAMLAVGLRGKRVDDHPLCRGCGFDLIATVGAAAMCPECGRELGAARAIRIGHRRRQRGVLALGVLVLLAAGVCAALEIRGSRLKINQYLPTPVLMMQSRGGTASAGAAVGELHARMKAGRLADADARVLVERGLSLQGKSGSAWASEWGDFLEGAWGKGLLSDRQRAAYAKNGVKFRFVMRDPARQGEKCGVSLEVSMQRVGNTMAFFVSPTLKELKIGGKAIEVGTLNASIGLMGAGGTGTVSEEIVLDVEPGDYAVQSVWGVSVGMGIAGSSPLATWETEQQGKLKVVGRDTELVKRIADESLRPQIESAVSVSGLAVAGDGEGRHATGRINVKNSPAPLAFEVYLRDESGKEWRVATLTVPAGSSSNHSMSFGGDTPGLTATKVDVVLKPSVEAAQRTVFLLEMWDGEIVIRGAAVKQPDEEK